MLKSKILILTAITVIISGFLNLPEAVKIIVNILTGLLVAILSLLIFHETKNISPLLNLAAGLYLFISAFIGCIISSGSSYMINNLLAGFFINNTSTICLLKYIKSGIKIRHTAAK
ncbi:MAG TPA: hypothetical protein PK447_10525 [Ignavibacteria bacterium]|nr:hypothetical protein [Ignavibacteria bacterium]